MDPITLAALAAGGISAISKIFGGGKQVRDAEKLAASNKFTRYKTPEQVLQATRLAEENYRNGLPGVDRAQNRIGTNMASAMDTARQGASSSGDLIDAATRINFGADKASNELSDQEAVYKSQALGGYMGALNNEAGYKDKEYQINYLDPYIRKANTAAAMYGAGKINRANGWDSVGTTALTAAQLVNNGNPSQKTMGQIMGNPTFPRPVKPGLTPQSSGLPSYIEGLPWYMQQGFISPIQKQPLNSAAIASASFGKNGH